MELSNKVALVTGASRGIGRAVALELAKKGAFVVINFAKNEAEAQKTLELVKAQGGRGVIKGFDVASAALADRAIDEVVESHGPIDILVNNAGIAIDGLLLRLKEADIDSQLSVNLKGAFFCAKACSRSMIKNRCGRIINVTSVVGQMGNAGQSVYAAAKAGLIGMTKALAKELAKRNILVNAVAPGYIETDMTKGIVGQAQEVLLSSIPLGRIGQPEEVAKVVAFLASDGADYITGQVLSVNGGLYI